MKLVSQSLKSWLVAAGVVLSAVGHLAPCQAAVLFAETNNALAQRWVSETFAPAPDPLWRVVTNAAYSCSNVWWCGPTGATVYGASSNIIDSGLTMTSNIALPATAAVLTFREQFCTEWGLDDCQIWGSTNSGTTWFPMARERWGNSQGLQCRAIRLTNLTNCNFRLRFRFSTTTKHLNNYAGWYLDDIKIRLASDDTDGDGLPDYEEDVDRTEPSMADTDNDGVTDWNELYISGTDPSSKTSNLAFSKASPSSSNAIAITWAAAPDRAYTVSTATSLTGTWSTASGGAVSSSPTGTLCSMVLTQATATGYFRVSTSNGPALPTVGFGCDAAGHAALYTNRSVFWGDFHVHTMFSNDAVSNEHCNVTPYQALTGCVGRLDFVAITDHAETNVPGMYTYQKWTNMLAMEQTFQAQYSNVIVFPAFEYTCTSTSHGPGWPIPPGNGHRNIILRDFEHLPPLGHDSARGFNRSPDPQFRLLSHQDLGTFCNHQHQLPL